MAVDTEDNQGDYIAGNGDAGGNIAPNPPPPAAPPTEPPAGGGDNVLREGDDLHDGDENMEGNNSDLNEWGQTSFTGPRTRKGSSRSKCSEGFVTSLIMMPT